MSVLIKTILHTILNSSNNWQLMLLTNWETIVGNLKTKVQLVKINEDTLVLGVIDSCWMQELHLLSPLLIKRINESLDQPRIKNLRFKSIGLPKKRETRSHIEKRMVHTPVKLSEREEQTLAAMKDPQLREVLQQYLIRCYQERE